MFVLLIPVLGFSKTIRIGVGQISTTSNIESNTRKIINALEFQKTNMSRLVVFPEFSLTGYGQFLEYIDSERLSRGIDEIIKKSKSLNIAVALPIIRFKNDRKYNSVLMIDNGEVIGSIDKVGLGSGFESRIFDIGENRSRYILLDGLKIGIMLCREMAHNSYHYLNELDLPDVILWPSVYAWPRAIDWNHPQVEWVKRVKSNIDIWNIPVIQSNLVLPLPLSDLITGGSISFAKGGKFLSQAKADLDDHFYQDVEVK